MSDKDSRVPVITDDGNARLTVVESDLINKDPKDYPKLTVEHLMHQSVEAPIDNRVGREMDQLMSRELRAKAVGAGFFKAFRDHPVILYEMYLLGPAGWVAKIKETLRPDSLADGLTDAELGLAWEVFQMNIQRAAKAGAEWRKRHRD